MEPGQCVSLFGGFFMAWDMKGARSGSEEFPEQSCGRRPTANQVSYQHGLVEFLLGGFAAKTGSCQGTSFTCHVSLTGGSRLLLWWVSRASIWATLQGVLNPRTAFSCYFVARVVLHFQINSMSIVSANPEIFCQLVEAFCRILLPDMLADLQQRLLSPLGGCDCSKDLR